MNSVRHNAYIEFPLSLYIFYLMFGIWLFSLLVYLLSFFKYNAWLVVCIISGIGMIISLKAALNWGKELERKKADEEAKQNIEEKDVVF